MSSTRRSVAPPSRHARRHKGGDEEDLPADKCSWNVLSGNVSVISRQYHSLVPMEGGDVTRWHIISGNVPVVSLDLWKLRQMRHAEAETKTLPGDWSARIDPKTQRTYYYSRKLKKTQWTVPVSAGGASAGGGAAAGAGAGAGGNAGAGSAPAPAAPTTYVDAMDNKAYDWVAKKDPGSGRTYYFSALRHKTQWHAPTKVAAGTKARDDWLEKKTADGRKYYFSPSRNITSWTIPKDAHANPGGAQARDTADLNKHGLPGDWRPVHSKSSGKTYYHSKSLNKTQWTKPEVPASTSAGSDTAAVPDAQPAMPPTTPAKSNVTADADSMADLLGAAAAPSLPPAGTPAGGGPSANGGDTGAGGGANGGGDGASRGGGLDRVPSFRDPTDPGYVPTDAPPAPDLPPTLEEAEDEAFTTEYDYEGYLMKKGGGKRLFGRKNWQKRYFVMIDAQLAYFKSMEAYEGGQQPLKGTWISVAKYELVDGDDDLSFSLQPKKGEDVERNRPFFVRALTDADKEAWVEKITEAAKYDLVLSRQEAEAAALNAEAGFAEDDDGSYYSDEDNM